jgi:hypothetical protein
MCLEMAVTRPDDVLGRGKHAGYEWIVTNNGLGFRCGYVRLPMGHPWHGQKTDDLDDVQVHGGITFADPDVDCGKGEDSAWWIGFDCFHCGADLPDPSLRCKDPMIYNMFSLFTGAEIRTQEYVESECRSLCEQAAKAAHGGGRP